MNRAPAERHPDRVLLIGCSRNWGLTYYNTVLAVGMKKVALPLVVLSTPGEQSSGLHSKLRASGIAVVDDPCLDVAHVSSICRAARLISKLCVPGLNILHVEGFRHGVAGWLAKKSMSKDRALFVTTVLGASGHGSRIWPLYYAVGSAVLNVTADKVLLLCDEEKRKMLRCGLSPSKAGTGHFLVDHEFSSRCTGDRTMLQQYVGDPRLYDEARRKTIYLAQFWRHKHHKALIRAWRHLSTRLPDMLLVLAGSGPTFQECRELAGRLNVLDNICFVPRVPREAVPALLNLGSYGVVASGVETFGSCIVEPLLAGLPTSTTRVGIAHELAAVDGVHILESLEASALAGDLLRFFSNDRLALDQMRRGRAWVIEHCSESRFVSSLQASWSGLVSNLGLASSACPDVR